MLFDVVQTSNVTSLIQRGYRLFQSIHLEGGAASQEQLIE